ncbi:hypothetical protein H6S06_24085 [Escherichia coli]|nr:hypothetical protein H6S06_24085 [Escherichia coli]
MAAANKRVSNILAKSDEVLSDRVNASTLKEPEEIKLAMQVVVLRDKLEPYFAEGRYQDALVELAELREPVDAFFDKVMVMVDDKELRINRLTMLEKLRETVPARCGYFAVAVITPLLKSLPSGRLFLSLNNTATFNNLLLNKDCLIY